MGLKDWFSWAVNGFSAPKQQEKKGISARHGVWGRAYAVGFDGEKNAGEIGPILDYYLEHDALRARAWQAYLENEVAKTVLDRFTVWVMDRGLRLQCTPSKLLLKSENIEFDTDAFNQITEARFNVWSKSKRVSYNGMLSLNSMAKEAFKNAKIGGDVLVVLRYDGKNMTVELIDGAKVGSATLTNKNAAEGNRIIDGVEVDKKGTHIAYHVRKGGGFATERIVARSKSTGLLMAWLVYGSKFRLNETRGIPKIATSLETLAKLDRYKEAAVGSAEERQKIAFAIQHNQFSSGESPMVSQLANMVDADNAESAAIPVDEQGAALAATVAATTNKQVFNMPIGSQLMQLESKNEMFFKDFFGSLSNVICGAIGIPPNVAFSLYNDSFSASRAATKDWEHTIEVERDDMQVQFYNPILAFWLHIQIIDGKIDAPGYLKAFDNENWMVTEAFLNARFTGPMFPHIDPKKEAEAERVKLGPKGENIPLTTAEASTERLGTGDYDHNVEQFAEEIKQAEELGLVSEPDPEPAPTT